MDVKFATDADMVRRAEQLSQVSKQLTDDMTQDEIVTLLKVNCDRDGGRLLCIHYVSTALINDKISKAYDRIAVYEGFLARQH